MESRAQTKDTYQCKHYRGRFANFRKKVGTTRELAKARYVAQGHNDKMKLLVVRNTPTLRQTSTTMMIGFACILELQIWLLDTTHAYLQSKDKM